MKKTFRNILIVLICFSCLYSFISCSEGIDRDEADIFIKDFLDAVAAEDYDNAEQFLHPECPIDLEQFFLIIEEIEKIDFQAGIEFEKRTGFSSSYYNSSVGGSRYQPTIRIKVGDNSAEMIIEIVKNKEGYGIYNLDIVM